MDNFDLIVIGAGPGGYEAALKAGASGKKVLLIEKDQLGGVCTNKGCIPTKSLLNSAKHFFYANNSSNLGVISTDVKFSLAQANTWKEDCIATLKSGIEFLLKKQKVTLVYGKAVILDSNTISVNSVKYSCTYLVLATGSSPMLIPVSGVENALTSNEILNLKKIPKSIAIIGGGVIGVEFASYFNLLGVEVTVIEMLPEILPMMDKDLAKLMRRELKPVNFKLQCKVTSITSNSVTYDDKKGNSVTTSADIVLLSSGRAPNTEGLTSLNLEYFKRWVKVDDKMETSIKGVYAIGDLNGISQLAHSATEMAEVAINNIFGSKTKTFNRNTVPWAVYSQPEASGCGVTESQCSSTCKVGTALMRSNGRFLAENGKKATGKVKVIANENDEIIGLHIIGPYASELIWSATILILQKVKVTDVANSVFAHPSVSEVIKEACNVCL